MSFPTLALISDFGEQDGFVGVIKGVIYRHIQSADNLTANNPSPPLIDVSHRIAPQNVWEAAWVLNSTYRDFPKFTIFVCVVDPKRGTSKHRPLLLYWPDRKQYFLAPDNGLLTPIIKAAQGNAQVYVIENDSFFQTEPDGELSHLFHGRDIYAPVAGHLANALIRFSPQDLLCNIGSKTDTYELLDWHEPERDAHYINGRVFHVDVFGNLVTNIPNNWVPADAQIEVQLMSERWETRRLGSYVTGHGEHQPFLVPSTSGTLSLNLFRESARDYFKAKVGDCITVYVKPAADDAATTSADAASASK